MPPSVLPAYLASDLGVTREVPETCQISCCVHSSAKVVLGPR